MDITRGGILISTAKQVNKYYLFLSKIALFKNIDEQELIDFINLVKVKQYYRGEMVTFDSQEHDKCYIVYDGLFKLTRMDEKGEEMVITIANKRSIVSPMHFSKHYEICAEFVKNTTLLYFNKDEIDSFTAKNHQFAMNVIDFLAESVQLLMLSAEVLQLKTAKEKVGWYMVQSKINNNFKLPYPKNLIAAYLGMKPESFSRALVQLKKDGIKVENKVIVLDDINELCQYCDKVTGANCRSFKTLSCAHY